MRPKSSMHGGKKSDSPIVAMKPANKTASTVAEPAEPRGGAKGNAVEQSTPRTQSRTSVSHALGRIRQAARERPKERLTALYHHVTIDLLHAAYAALRREAAAGVDGVTWSTYGENLEANLQSLHHRVHGGAYRAQPSRRRYIPKPERVRSASPRSHRTALRSSRPLGSAEITHPFHPLRGQRFVVLKVRTVSGVETLSLRQAELGSFAVAREWTDWAPPGAQAVPSDGKALLIDASGLLALDQLVASLTRTVKLDQ